MGPQLTQVGTAMTAGITVPILAIAGFAMKSASDVNGALRSITRETGLTGVAADSMKASFKTVASEVPSSFNEVADAMTMFIQRTGLSGAALETLTKQALDMSRMMGTDVKATTDAVTTAFVAFGVPAKDMETEMDRLFVLFQKTGVPMDQVTAAMDKMAPTSRALGLTFDQTAATIAKFAEAGLPARQTVSMLTGFVNKMASEGKNAGEEWKLMFERIKAGTATKADVDLFGASWTKVSDAVKTGKFDIEDLTKAMNDSKGAIDDTAHKTASFGDNMKTVMNQLEIAMQPVGSAIYEAFASIMPLLTPLIGFIASITSAFSTLPGPIKMVIIAIAGIAAALGPIILFLPTIAAAVPIIMAIAAAAGAILIPLLPIIIAVVAIGAAFYLLYTYVKPFHDAVNAAFQVIKQMADLLMKGDFGGAFKLLGDSLKNIDWGGILNSIKNWFDSIDWRSVGTQVGNLVGSALVEAFKVAVDIYSWLASAFASLIGGGEATTAGQGMGTQAKGGFLDYFGGVAGGIQTQLSRIHINWGVILGDVGQIFADLGAIAGAGMITAFAEVWNKSPAGKLLHIDTEGVIPKAMGDLKSDLNKFSGDLKTNIAVTGDLNAFKTQIDAATLQHHETLITAKAITDVANSDLSAFTKQSRIADIIAAAQTAIADSDLTAVEKKSRIAEIVALANTVDANGNLNALAIQRLAEILAVANPGDAAAVFDALSKSRTAVINVVYNVSATPGLPAGYVAAPNAMFAEGGIVKAAHGLITQGPTLVMAGEAGDEAFIPLKGGKVPVSINVSGGSSMSIPSVGGRLSSSASGTIVNYNTYVTVDSENVTRKVLGAIRENENYHQMGV